jgi:hypothetical protein
MVDESMLKLFEQLLMVFHQSCAKPLHFAGFLLLMAFDQVAIHHSIAQSPR